MVLSQEKELCHGFQKPFRKELFDNPKTAAVIKEMAPQLLKYPVKMFNKKSCGEIFDRVVKVGIVPLDQAKKIEAKVNEIIK